MNDAQLPNDARGDRPGNNHPDDDLDALLAIASPPVDGSARLNLRGRTTRVFVRRRRLRRIRRVAALAACYLAGIGSWYAYQSLGMAAPVDSMAVDASTPLTAERPFAPATPQYPSVARRPSLSADGPAKHQKKSQFASLCELGDQHLLASRDPERATRCYRMALRYATPEERAAASRNGTWLLRVICNDPFTVTSTEKDHASNKS